MGGPHLGVGRDPTLEEPDGEVLGQLLGPLFQLGKAGRRQGHVLGEEALEDGVGVLAPLAAQLVVLIRARGRCAAHGDSFSGGTSGP